MLSFFFANINGSQISLVFFTQYFCNLMIFLLTWWIFCFGIVWTRAPKFLFSWPRGWPFFSENGLLYNFFVHDLTSVKYGIKLLAGDQMARYTSNRISNVTIIRLHTQCTQSFSIASRATYNTGGIVILGLYYSCRFREGFCVCKLMLNRWWLGDILCWMLCLCMWLWCKIFIKKPFFGVCVGCACENVLDSRCFWCTRKKKLTVAYGINVRIFLSLINLRFIWVL